MTRHLALMLCLSPLALMSPGCDDESADADADVDADADADADADVDADADADQGDGDLDGDVVHVPEEPGCENLNPRFCSLPYPSARYLEPDDTTATGYRLALTPEFLPPSVNRASFDFTPYERLDGMSPASQIMTLYDRPPDLTDAAGFATIERSLEPTSPTVIVDMETGERVAHWVELDARADSEEETVVFLRLASRLQENRSYAVAIRGLSDADDEPIAPSDAFRALRDGLPTDSAEIEGRRAGFETMFTALTAAGVERGALIEAWWFHTASGEAIRGDLLHARADALERLGAEGIGCTVVGVDEGYGDDGLTLRRVRGTYTVPSYMDSPVPPARFVRGDDGMPEFVENVEVPWTMIIPEALTEGGPHAGPMITYGHGLMGTAEDTLSWTIFRNIAQRTGAVLIGTDWAGMSTPDALTVASALSDVSMFVNVMERLQQGMINQIALTRTFAGICSSEPEFFYEGVNLLDTSELYYVGASQGGIYGGTLLAISPDISRGVLLVNGTVFPFMMERSIDYVPYLPYFEEAYPVRLHQAMLLPMAQHLWDMADPASYLPFYAEGLPDIGPKQVLSIADLNDAQVPNLSTDQAMRMVGAPLIEGTARQPWGFEVVASPYTGSGYLTIDVGDPSVPETNTAPTQDGGGHTEVGQTETAIQAIQTFLYTGEIVVDCDGVCDPD
jgi:hypothetical protein